MASTSESALSDNADSSSFNTEGCIELTESPRVPTTQTFGFDVQSRKTDLALVIEGKSAYVNRAVLELMSPVFQTLLDANEGKESLELVGHTYGDFVEFLACCYPGKGNKVTESNVFRLLPLAETYNVLQLINQCEFHLEAMLKSSSTAPEVLVSCVQAVCYYKFDTLTPKCESTLKRLVLNDTEKLHVGNEPFGTLEFYSMLMPLMVDSVQKYRYLSVVLSKERQLTMWDNVKYFTVPFCRATDRSVYIDLISEIVPICGLKFFITSQKMNEGNMWFSLQCCNENTLLTSCEGEVTFVVVNNVPWKDDLQNRSQFKSSPRKIAKTLASFGVMKHILWDDDAGYKMDEQIHMVAHVILNATIMES